MAQKGLHLSTTQKHKCQSLRQTCEQIFCSQGTRLPLPTGSSTARGNPSAAGSCLYVNKLASEKNTNDLRTHITKIVLLSASLYVSKRGAY